MSKQEQFHSKPRQAVSSLQISSVLALVSAISTVPVGLLLVLILPQIIFDDNHNNTIDSPIASTILQRLNVEIVTPL